MQILVKRRTHRYELMSINFVETDLKQEIYDENMFLRVFPQRKTSFQSFLWNLKREIFAGANRKD